MDGSAVILLSDESDDEVRGSKKSEVDDLEVSDFDAQFPKINLYGLEEATTSGSSTKDVTRNINDTLQEYNLDSPNDLESENHNDYDDTNFKSDLNKDQRKESQSDSDYESQDIQPTNYYDRFIKSRGNEFPKNTEKSSDEDEESEEEKSEPVKRRGRKNGEKTKKELNEEAKKKRQEEREQNKIKKQEEASRKKALRELNSKNRLILKPEHSLKLMKISIDQELEKFDFFNDFLKAAEEFEFNYEINSKLVPNSITWQRRVDDNYIDDKNEVCSYTTLVEESITIIIWNYDQAVLHIDNGTFVAAVENIKSLVPNQRLTLVIYKIVNYFKQQKNVKNKSEHSDDPGPSKRKKKAKTDETSINIPKISRKKFEECLTEIEVLHGVSSRLIETSAEMVSIIRQHTKALALLPAKLEKNKQSDKYDWYIDCDNRDTIKVDKSGNGLKRLWQQQLCQFTLMRLEAAEAIASVYKSPVQLMKAYDDCSPTEGEKLLKDLPIRRAAGPITTVRKIGPELSRKIYIMFTSRDGDVRLNDQEN